MTSGIFCAKIILFRTCAFFSITFGILETCLTFELFYNLLQFIFMGETYEQKMLRKSAEEVNPSGQSAADMAEDMKKISKDYGSPHHSAKHVEPGTPGYDTLPGATES